MKKKLFILTFLFILSFFHVKAQLFVETAVGTNTHLTEKGKGKAGVTMNGVIGYTVNPIDATRIYIALFGQLRQLRAENTNQEIKDMSDELIGLKAGFDVGQRFRMGINFGGQLAPWASNSERNYKRFGGFTEGTISYNRSDGMSIGAALKAERSLRANRLFPEQEFGKTIGTWTAQGFIRKTFGKKKKQISAPYNPSLNSTLKTEKLLRKDEATEFILTDSTFGKAITGFVNTMVKEAMDEHIESKHSPFPIQTAQPLTPNTITPTPEDIPKPYIAAPAPKILNRFETFFGVGTAVLSQADKDELDYRTRGISIETNFRIYAYTSSDGGTAENKKLCKQRAVCVEAFLKTKGFKNFYTNLYPRAGTNTAYRRTVVEFLK